MTGILGKKIGMTRTYSEDGRVISITAIEAGPCPILAVKEKHIQLGFDAHQKESRIKKPLLGYFKKIKVTPQKFIREVTREPSKEYKVGEEVKVDLFKTGDYIDVTGTSIGKGFQGGMKRWHWHGGPMTHGSTSHRRVGSIGSSTTPGRVWKGHHLPGHMGNARVTTQNLKVVKVDAANNILLVKGSVPGPKNRYLIIRKAKKKSQVSETTVKQTNRTADKPNKK